MNWPIINLLSTTKRWRMKPYLRNWACGTIKSTCWHYMRVLKNRSLVVEMRGYYEVFTGSGFLIFIAAQRQCRPKKCIARRKASTVVASIFLEEASEQSSITRFSTEKLSKWQSSAGKKIFKEKVLTHRMIQNRKRPTGGQGCGVRWANSHFFPHKTIPL